MSDGIDMTQAGFSIKPVNVGRGSDPAMTHCRRCFALIPYNDYGSAFCSDYCENFAPQQPFDALYRRMHPEYPGKRGTNPAPWVWQNAL